MFNYKIAFLIIFESEYNLFFLFCFFKKKNLESKETFFCVFCAFLTYQELINVINSSKYDIVQ